jgi:hypothetical protein
MGPAAGEGRGPRASIVVTLTSLDAGVYDTFSGCSDILRAGEPAGQQQLAGLLHRISVCLFGLPGLIENIGELDLNRSIRDARRMYIRRIGVWRWGLAQSLSNAIYMDAIHYVIPSKPCICLYCRIRIAEL